MGRYRLLWTRPPRHKAGELAKKSAKAAEQAGQASLAAADQAAN
ncbi:hypothetical protein ACFYZJ_32085 [Streptomyces sp. NPDC001848]